jgi:hypothetical protein
MKIGGNGTDEPIVLADVTENVTRWASLNEFGLMK